jgi:NADPH:quinone reductase-like Zn-dependent oxidoreductase
MVEPVYGCWEANMTHAINRQPIDICLQRNEEKVVIGNAGVVRVLETGRKVNKLREGDFCLVFCNGVWDELGFPKEIYAYDAPGSIGLLAKRTKLHEKQLLLIPEGTRHSLKQWAAFSLRYITAWANWKVAYGCWRLQVGEENDFKPLVWGWGGGVSLAELTLAKFWEGETAMISSLEERLRLIERMGITPIDRRRFPDLRFDAQRYQNDPDFKEEYLASEEAFLRTVNEHTDNKGVSIFIDFIGAPVVRATLKSLARPGVITTAGWKEGMTVSAIRAIECMMWHTHVHTHYARFEDGRQAMQFAEKNGWMPPIEEKVYAWDEIPQLALDYLSGKITTYFPIYQVNPL